MDGEKNRYGLQFLDGGLIKAIVANYKGVMAWQWGWGTGTWY